MANGPTALYTAARRRGPGSQATDGWVANHGPGISMRIAFITTMASAPWGGSEALWAATARAALEAGHEVFISVYGWSTTPSAIAELEAKGAQIHRRKVSRRWRRSGLLMWLFYPFSALHEFRPDVVLVNQGSTYDISRSKEFTRLRRALIERERWPFVLLCHCEQKAPARRRALERARQAFKAARIVGILSKNLRATSEDHLGIPLPHARLFQNPLNISATRLLDWPQSTTLRFAFVGRTEYVKGLDLALAAFNTPTWRERDWQFDIYGDGDLKDQLQRQTQQLGLADKIRFRGFATDIDAVWRDHHVFLLPSRAEGVPNSMLEAMLSGRPVIVSDVGGIAEWVDDGRTGYLMPRPDVDALANALERCWNDRDRLEQMGRAAYELTLARRDRDPDMTLLHWLEEIGNVAVPAQSPATLIRRQASAGT